MPFNSIVKTKDRPLHVVHVIKGLGRGGAEVLLVEGGRVADRESFIYSYVHFLPAHEGIAQALRAQGAGVEQIGSGSKLSVLASVFGLARYLKRVKADIVHAHLPLSGVVARLAASMAGVPIVYSEHNVMDRYHPVTMAAVRLTWKMQSLAIAVSPDVENSIHRNVGTVVDTQVVLNGINTDAFARPIEQVRRQVRSDVGIPDSAPVVGTVARFRPAKRLDLWLQSAALIRSRLPDAHFLIVGDGELRSEIDRDVADLGLQDAVHMVGLQDDVPPYLSAMDVFLMSSEFEGFGLAPVEAMSMGVPVVSTEVSGIRNVLADTSGILVPFDNNVAAGLADAVVEVLADEEAASKLASLGRQSAVNKFGIGRMQRELETIYKKYAE